MLLSVGFGVFASTVTHQYSSIRYDIRSKKVPFGVQRKMSTKPASVNFERADRVDALLALHLLSLSLVYLHHPLSYV